MKPTVPVALFGWVPLSILFFATMRPRRALLLTVIGGWLFLPCASYRISGLPDYTKLTAIALGALIGAAIFASDRFSRYRFHVCDVPVAILCLIPLLSAPAAGLTLQDGFSFLLTNLLSWGIPYFLGRCFFDDLEGLKELMLAVFVGGLVYMPLCWFEMRMSPILNYRIYGFSNGQWIQSMRGGGWRPTVFLQHGLAVGMWMAASAVAGLWLWLGVGLRRLKGVPMWLLALSLIVTSVLCRSAGALALMIIGLAAFPIARYSSGRIVVAALVLFAPFYMIARGTDYLRTDTVVNALTPIFPPDRVASAKGRLLEEDTLVAHAKERLFLGWGPWGAYRESDAPGSKGRNLVSATDGFWVIILGKYGLPGIIGFAGLFLLPGLVLLFKRGRGRADRPDRALLWAGALILALYMADCLSNAMENPIFCLLAGGLVSSMVAMGAETASSRVAVLHATDVEAERVPSP